MSSMQFLDRSPNLSCAYLSQLASKLIPQQCMSQGTPDTRTSSLDGSQMCHASPPWLWLVVCSG